MPDQGIYAALVDFYDDRYQGQPVRVAVLLQPVAGHNGRGLATIQVAETLELRQTLARQMLLDTLWRQAALMAVIGAVVWWVVQQAPRELQPLIAATNAALARQARLLAHQKRFVRDASHQLRTPLAVLKVQVQSALRGDVAAEQALAEIGHTVDGATRLANQMLALAKVEQLRQEADMPATDWATVVREVALDLAPLIADAGLDFDLALAPVTVRAHAWALRELSRNLLHNALKHTPMGGSLAVSLEAQAGEAVLTVADSGPGIPDTLRPRLTQPFASGGQPGSAGLGLAICREIVQSLGGQLALDNRLVVDRADGRADARIAGLDARVHLPLADNAPP
ncbi:MAG: sensor histidine kinase [Burkholderiales bacterium PBB5]|nr:MAG: sensor histidine kinase [Burkholderiales bacterium PBB5]